MEAPLITFLHIVGEGITKISKCFSIYQINYTNNYKFSLTLIVLEALLTAKLIGFAD